LLALGAAANGALDGLSPAATAAARTAKTIKAEPIATGCEDTPFPWSQADPVSVRRSKAAQMFNAIPESAIAPFARDTISESSGVKSCVGWPEAGTHPPRITGPLPRVPALVLSGTYDIRTPIEDAQAVASQLQGATLLPVSNVGHAVLANDKSGCAQRAVSAFLDARPVAQCPATAPAAVDPLPPASVDSLPPAPVLSGAPGRVLTALVLTLRHDVGFALPLVGKVGISDGTQGGYFRLRFHHGEYASLHQVSYVPGIALTGQLNLSAARPYAPGRLEVSLDRGSYGTVMLSPDGSIKGRLGGASFTLSGQQRQAIVATSGLTKPAGS
jgi:hypothetical protein